MFIKVLYTYVYLLNIHKETSQKYVQLLTEKLTMFHKDIKS